MPKQNAPRLVCTLDAPISHHGVDLTHAADHLMMKLSRHTTPRLRRGRWYFEVVGKSFMTSSRYWIKYELKSEEVLRNERSFGSEVEEEVWENERCVL